MIVGDEHVINLREVRQERRQRILLPYKMAHQARRPDAIEKNEKKHFRCCMNGSMGEDSSSPQELKNIRICRLKTQP